MADPYSAWLSANPGIVNQALQRYAPPQTAAGQGQASQQATGYAAPPPPQSPAQPQAQPAAEQVQPVKDDLYVGHPDSNSEGIGKVASMIASQKSGDSGKSSGSGLMGMVGSILSFL